MLTAAPRPCPPPPPRRPPFVREIGAHSARSSPQPGRRTCTAQELLDHRPPRSRRWSGGQLSSSNTRLSMRTLVLVVRLYPTLRRAASRAPSETHTRRSSSHGRRLAGGGGPAITDCFCRHHCCSRGRSRMMCMGQVALERSFLRRCQAPLSVVHRHVWSQKCAVAAPVLQQGGRHTAAHAQAAQHHAAKRLWPERFYRIFTCLSLILLITNKMSTQAPSRGNVRVNEGRPTKSATLLFLV